MAQASSSLSSLFPTGVCASTLEKVLPFLRQGVILHLVGRRQALRSNVKFPGACKKKDELGEGDPQKKRELEAMISGDPAIMKAPPLPPHTHPHHTHAHANKSRQAVSVSWRLKPSPVLFGDLPSTRLYPLVDFSTGSLGAVACIALNTFTSISEEMMALDPVTRTPILTLKLQVLGLVHFKCVLCL